MRIIDVEPLLNTYTKAEDYMRPFGVMLVYANGYTERFTDLGLALCRKLTKSQRKYVEDLQKEIEGKV